MISTASRSVRFLHTSLYHQFNAVITPLQSWFQPTHPAGCLQTQMLRWVGFNNIHVHFSAHCFVNQLTFTSYLTLTHNSASNNFILQPQLNDHTIVGYTQVDLHTTSFIRDYKLVLIHLLVLTPVCSLPVFASARSSLLIISFTTSLGSRQCVHNFLDFTSAGS